MQSTRLQQLDYPPVCRGQQSIALLACRISKPPIFASQPSCLFGISLSIFCWRERDIAISRSAETCHGALAFLDAIEAECAINISRGR